MTIEEVSRINYIIGRIEGIAAGCKADIQTALLDTAEMLDALIESNDGDA